MEELSPFAITKRAYLFVFSDFKRLLKFVWPFLAIGAIGQAIPSLDFNQLRAGVRGLGGEFSLYVSLIGILHLYCWLVFSVSWTRRVLLPSESLGMDWRLSGRFWRTLKFALIIPLSALVLLLAFIIIFIFLPQDILTTDPNSQAILLMVCGYFCLAVVFLKFGFTYPSAAMDDKPSLSQSMDISEGATLRVAWTALLLIGAFLPLKFLPSLIYFTGGSPGESMLITLRILSTVNGTLGAAVFFAGWSLIYDWGRKRLQTAEPEPLPGV